MHGLALRELRKIEMFMDNIIQKEKIDLLDLADDEVVYFTGGANKINDLDLILRYEIVYPYQIVFSKTLGARSSTYLKCLGAIKHYANFSRIKGEINLFVNQNEYMKALNLVDKNNLLYNNNSEKDYIKRLVSYIFNN
jgi:hypothetical protein